VVVPGLEADPGRLQFVRHGVSVAKSFRKPRLRQAKRQSGHAEREPDDREIPEVENGESIARRIGAVGSNTRDASAGTHELLCDVGMCRGVRLTKVAERLRVRNGREALVDHPTSHRPHTTTSASVLYAVSLANSIRYMMPPGRPPVTGATRKSQGCDSAAVSAKSAAPVLRAGFTDVG